MSIIVSKAAKLQLATSTQAPVPGLRPAIIRQLPNAAPDEADLLVKKVEDGGVLLAQDLKKVISFRALMEADNHQLQVSGKYVKCRCPFHPDKTPSFFIDEDDSRAKCYGCNWYGDIIKYEMAFHHVEFKEAWWRLNDFLRCAPRTGRKAKQAPKKAAAAQELTKTQLEERKKYAQRLATESWVAEEVCRKRFEENGQNWEPAVIRQLAAEGSLGWANDCLAFIYPHGTKYRQWPSGQFRWDCQGVSLWRAHGLGKGNHVYLMESETDAIALLHTGVEEKKPGQVVVAAPSATTFKDEWAPLFKEKVVVLCYDNDRAGKQGVEQVARLLGPYAKEVRFLNWNEVFTK